MSGGLINCPIVIRGPANGGTNVGATHSHTPENVLANHPGVKVVVPATALRRQGPAQVRHPRQRPRLVPREHHPLRRQGRGSRGGISHPARQGRRETRAPTSPSSPTAAACSSRSPPPNSSSKSTTSRSKVVDLRSIRPLDIDTVLASVAKTHRVLIVEEQKPFCQRRLQLAYMIQREAFDELDAPDPPARHHRRARDLQPAGRERAAAEPPARSLKAALEAQIEKRAALSSCLKKPSST
jgi:pyruvate dehydrogenase E1 component beta subunit